MNGQDVKQIYLASQLLLKAIEVSVINMLVPLVKLL